MAKQVINVGTLADDGTGDTVRAAFQKANANFTETYGLLEGTGAGSMSTLAAGTSSLGVTTISGAAPVLNFKDTSCADADVNASIQADATVTTSNAEDITVALKQQVGGVLTSFLTSTAGGALALGYTGQAATINGVTINGTPVISSATPVIQFKDTSCADADVNASIQADAVTPTSNAENITVAMKQQVSGTLVAFLTSTAGGALALGYGGQATTVNDLTVNGTPLVNSATPIINFKDTSCSDADVNAAITVAATATGSNAEDIDVSLSQQVGGVLTDFLVADANGNLTLGHASQPVVAAALSATQLTHNSRVVPASFVFTHAAGAVNVVEVTVKVCNSAGTPIATVHNVDVWLSDVATGEGLTGTTPSGAVAVKAASGADLLSYVTKKAWRSQTLATGLYTVSIEDSAKSPYYICAQVGDLVGISDPLVSGDYGAA